MRHIALALLLTLSCADHEAPDLHEGSIMPALTFTANHTTDRLTITGHGLVTGDGPATPRNVGGALPTGLTALTDYWIIRIDNDTVQLAASSADALAGTPVTFTSNGTGTQLLEIGIPYRRPRTYGAGSQLKSADLNANFDAWKAVHALLTGQTQAVWDGVSLAVPLTARVTGTLWLLGADGIPATTTTLTLSGAHWQSTTSGAQQDVIWRVPVPVGSKITSITVYGRSGGSAGEELVALFVKEDTSGAPTQIGVTKSSALANGDTSIGWTTADTGFTPSGYEVTDAPHLIQVPFLPTSVAGEIAVYSIKITLG